MLLLIKSHRMGSGLMLQYAACSEIELSLFGCVAREERPPVQRRKRGCKSRHIHLSPDSSLGMCLTETGYEKRQPAVSRKSSLAYTSSTPLPVYHRFILADIRSDRRPAGDIFCSQDLGGSGNWLDLEIDSWPAIV